MTFPYAAPDRAKYRPVSVDVAPVEHAILRLGGGSGLAFLPPGSFLEEGVSSVGEESELPLLDAREPVAKAATNAGIDGIDPEGFLVEERAHLNAELPESCSDACGEQWLSVDYLVRNRRWWATHRGRSRTGPCGPL